MNPPIAYISGVGSYVPDQVLTNEDIERMRPLDIPPEEWTDDAWIFTRTGIKRRHIAPANWASSDLMVEAAKRALVDADLKIKDIDLILTSSSFADKGSNVPRTSEIVKDKLGLPQSTLSDEANAECAGFVWALDRAEMEIAHHGFENVLVVSGDKISAFTNWRDRKTCILFGDAAGSAIVSRIQKPNFDYGILATARGTRTRFVGENGKEESLVDSIRIPAGGSAMPIHQAFDKETGKLQKELFYMQMPGGNKMLKFIGRDMAPEYCHKVCDMAGVPFKKIKRIIPHPANIRITDIAEDNLGLKGKGVFFKAPQRMYGNPSGSGAPLALDLLYRAGLIEEDDYIIIVVYGAGFTIAAALIRWAKPKYTR